MKIEKILKQCKRTRNYYFSRLKLTLGHEVVVMSIQGGESNYSFPREDLETITSYEEVEVAFIVNNELLTLDVILGNYLKSDEYKIHRDYFIEKGFDVNDYIDINDQVYAYVCLERIKIMLELFLSLGGIIENLGET